MTRASGIAAVLGLIAGCAGFVPATTVPERGLAPAGAVSDRAFEQVLVVRFGDEARRLIAAGQICRGTLALSLLTPQGLELLRLRHGPGGLEVLQRRQLPDRLDARAVLADFQLVHWPAEALRAAWSGDWVLVAGPGRRELRRDGRLVARVDYAAARWDGAARLRHEARGYGLRVRPRRLEHAADAVDLCPPGEEGGA